jgi:hypothetical protein
MLNQLTGWHTTGNDLNFVGGREMRDGQNLSNEISYLKSKLSEN